MNPTVLHVATHGGIGGAGRACLRILDAQISVGIDSRLLCLNSNRLDPCIQVFEPRSTLDRLQLVQSLLSASRKFSRAANVPDSSREVGLGVVSAINDSKCDIVHLHWINGALSVRDIALIRKPIVWTLHDMWAFCGDAHYAEDSEWMTGFQGLTENHPERLAWQFKENFWRKPYQIVAPSQWLKDCVEASTLMRQWSTAVIPYPLCSDTWYPMDKVQARKDLGLPIDKRLILFGAVSGIRDPRKGFDLLRAAIQHLAQDKRELSLVAFGDSVPKDDLELGLPICLLGSIQDDETLRAIYSAADVFVAPSRLEAFGQTALEAQACGTPAVAFDNSGLRDTIAHKQTGYLAQAFDPVDLARGIDWVLDQMTMNVSQFRKSCHMRVKDEFNYLVIGHRYAELYKIICNQKGINVATG